MPTCVCAWVHSEPESVVRALEGPLVDACVWRKSPSDLELWDRRSTGGCRRVHKGRADPRVRCDNELKGNEI